MNIMRTIRMFGPVGVTGYKQGDMKHYNPQKKKLKDTK